MPDPRPRAFASATRSQRFTRFRGDGAPAKTLSRDVPVELPVAIEVNGLAIAVILATPVDLEDFAIGFARAEGLIGTIDELDGIDVHDAGDGCVVRLGLRGAARDRLLARTRTRATESACGLCGLSSLEAVLEPLPRLDRTLALMPEAVWRAIEALPPHQPMGRRTGATHAAALCDADGTIRLAREDVGRHSALDKLVGAALLAGVEMRDHFALVTSRLSFEMVEKAVRAPLGAIAAISAPSTLALDRAAAAGLPTFVLSRSDAMLAPFADG